MDWRPSDAIVHEAEGRHHLRIIDVPPVEDHGLLHESLHPLEVRPAEVIPLRQQQQGVSPLERVIVVIAVLVPVPTCFLVSSIASGS